jgi:predicted PurR-regulated permease PerM
LVQVILDENGNSSTLKALVRGIFSVVPQVGQVATLLEPRNPVSPGVRSDIAITRSLTILAVLGIIAALYFAKAILLPLALAILLTFVLAPLVRILESWSLGRIPSVVIVVVCTFLVIFGIGSFIGGQVAQLAEKLPRYQFIIQHKVQTASSAVSGGTLEQFSHFLDRLNKEIGIKNSDNSEGGSAGTGSKQGGGETNAPVPVEIHQPPQTAMEVMHQVLGSLLDPLATAGMVVIFVIFFLMQRRDLRDRLIRVAGSRDLQRTTEALNDAAHRLSRYFLAQTALNVVFGITVATGLGLIGIPNPVLWGILAMVLRFVPYIGAAMAAAFPIALAVAVDPGWSMTFWTIGLFVIVEPLIGQVIEPLVYGHSTGLSPVAVIIAATFWTWLWGPVGLLLSTPLTVCLGVLGRYIGWLQFVDVLIGDEPPLSPAQSFYQRALAGDVNELTDQAEKQLKRQSLSSYYDEVVLQGLILAEVDVRRGSLEEKQVLELNDAVRRLVDDLSEYEDTTPPSEPKPDEPAVSIKSDKDDPSSSQQPSLPILQLTDLPPEWASDRAILCVSGRGLFDEAATLMLAQLLEKHGLKTSIESDLAIFSSNVVRLNGPDVRMVCLSSLDIAHSPAHWRSSIRRLRRRLPEAKALAGLWGHDRRGASAEELRRSAGADLYAYSLREAVGVCIETARSGGAADTGTAVSPQPSTG